MTQQVNECGRTNHRLVDYSAEELAQEYICVTVHEGAGALSFISVYKDENGEVHVNLDLSDGTQHSMILGQPSEITKL